jgi:hypothetical protein
MGAEKVLLREEEEEEEGEGEEMVWSQRLAPLTRMLAGATTLLQRCVASHHAL